MNTQILKGTVFGGIANFFLGWLIYGMVLMDFMKSNSNQCANRPEMEMIWWAMIASCLVYALFLTLFLKGSGSSTWLDGLKNSPRPTKQIHSRLWRGNPLMTNRCL